MRSDEHWPSTKALSVYNALSLSGRDMRAGEIATFLQEVDDPGMDEAYVLEGLNFLLAHALVQIAQDIVVIPIRHPKTRMGRPLVKTRDETKLVYGRA